MDEQICQDYQAFMHNEDGVEGSLPMDCGPEKENNNYLYFSDFTNLFDEAYEGDDQ